jgi:hypothetical protein
MSKIVVETMLVERFRMMIQASLSSRAHNDGLFLFQHSSMISRSDQLSDYYIAYEFRWY